MGFATVLAAGAVLADDAQLQDVAQLEALAKSQAEQQFPPLTDRQRFAVGPLDARLKFEHCSLPLKASVGPGQHMRDRVMVELRCPGTPAWHIYVPVKIVGTSTVTMAARAIVVGSVLTDKDVR